MLTRHVSLTLLVAVLATLGVTFLLAGDANAASGTLTVTPASQTIAAPATNFNVTLMQNASVATTGSQADFNFNATALQIQSVALGSAYSGGSLIMGIPPQTQAQAIAEANTTGTLKNLAAFLFPPATVPSGSQQWVVITLQGWACGVSSPVTLTNIEMNDDAGQPLSPVSAVNGTITSTVVDINAPIGAQDWTVPAGDTDCDGFADTVAAGGRAPESFLGTDATKMCALTRTANDEPLPDNWPVDFNDDQLAGGQDILKYGPVFNKRAPGPPYTTRFDLNGDGLIGGQDVLKFGPYFNKKCK